MVRFDTENFAPDEFQLMHQKEERYHLEVGENFNRSGPKGCFFFSPNLGDFVGSKNVKGFFFGGGNQYGTDPHVRYLED